MTFKDLVVDKSELLPDVLIIRPSVFEDSRGNIFTSYNEELYNGFLKEGLSFIHDKFAQSKYNVLRGLHGDSKTWKLVSCVWGKLYEVVVDIRENSPTYKKWDSFELSSENNIQLLIPPGFVNGYYVESEYAVFHYKLAYSGEYFDVGEQLTLRWNDPELSIDWPCNNPILQNRDR